MRSPDFMVDILQLYLYTHTHAHIHSLQSDPAKLYSERLSQMIQFNWQEANRRKKGVITLEGLRLATSFIPLMRPVPLRFGEAISMQLFVK